MSEDLIFKASATKCMAWASANALGAYITSFGLLDGRIFTWALFIMFFMGTAGFLWIGLTNTMHIRVTEHEVIIHGMHKPIKYNLCELSSFYMTNLNRLKILVISYNQVHLNKSISSRILKGSDRFLLNIYSTPLNDICELLNTRLQNLKVMQPKQSSQPPHGKAYQEAQTSCLKEDKP